MRCLVCGQDFQRGDCPRCGFPMVESPDIDALMHSINEQIDAYRQDFLDKTRLELAVYRWRDEEGSLVSDGEERISFGACSALRGKTVWLPRQFARTPDAEELTLSVHAVGPCQSWEQHLSLRNLNEPGLQQVGLAMDDALNYHLLLRSGEAESASEPVPLLA